MNKEIFFWIGVFNTFVAGMGLHHGLVTTNRFMAALVAIQAYIGMRVLTRWNEQSVHEALTERIV